MCVGLVHGILFWLIASASGKSCTARVAQRHRKILGPHLPELGSFGISDAFQHSRLPRGCLRPQGPHHPGTKPCFIAKRTVSFADRNHQQYTHNLLLYNFANILFPISKPALCCYIETHVLLYFGGATRGRNDQLLFILFQFHAYLTPYRTHK